MNFTFLWIATIVMLICSIIPIIFVIWTSRTLRKEREFYLKRDAYFVQRMDEIESLVRAEFKELIQSIKTL